MSHPTKGENTRHVERSGLDIAQSSFEVHGVDTHGKVGIRKHLTRGKVLGYFAQRPRGLGGLAASGGAHDGMGNGTARPSGTPLTPQVQAETAARMVPEGTHDPQGQSQSAHHQAAYRRAVQSLLPVTSNTLAPPGASI